MKSDVLRFCQRPDSMEDPIVIRCPADGGERFRIGRLDPDLELDQSGPESAQKGQVFFP